jgi:hypothetical protein
MPRMILPKLIAKASALLPIRPQRTNGKTRPKARQLGSKLFGPAEIFFESERDICCIESGETQTFMNRITISVLATFIILVTGCGWQGIRGNGHITTDQRTVTAFSEIEADGAFQIEWRSGTPGLSVTTDENLQQHIENQNIDNRLRLHSHKNLRPTHGIKVVVSSPMRAGARLTGASRLIANQLSGAKFAVESTGAARVTLSGDINEFLADMTGASELNAKSLQTRIAEISTTGAADADISVSETLKVSITGAGKVSYSGNPPTIEKHITGAGSIRHKD